MKKVCAFMQKTNIMILVSAVLAALPMTFSWCFLLSWVGFVPLFVTELKKSEASRLRSAIGRWCLFGFVFNFCIYYWFWWLYPLDFLGLSNGTSLSIVLIAWLFVSIFHAVFYIIPAVLTHIVSKIVKKPSLTIMAAVVGILIAIKLTELGELAFPWVRISLGNYRVPILIQSLSIWGVEGLDFLVLSINALITLALVSEYEKRRFFAGSALAVFMLNLAFGVYRLCSFENKEEFSATVIQGNVLVDEKWEGNSAIESTYNIYTELTKNGITDDTDIVVWPETAVPINVAKSERWQTEFRRLSEEIGVPIYMGVNWRPEKELFNSAVMVDADGVSAPCSKRILVPFGEKIPFRETLIRYIPELQELDEVFSEYTAAPNVQIMETQFGRVGSIICFESIFPLFSREIAVNDADALFIITNDAWLEDSPAVEQHLAHSVFRSVENSKDTVRCANVGISAFIDSRGRIKSELKTLERGVLNGTVNMSEERTFYNIAGYMFLPFLIIVFAAVCIIVFISDRKKVLGNGSTDENNL